MNQGIVYVDTSFLAKLAKTGGVSALNLLLKGHDKVVITREVYNELKDGSDYLGASTVLGWIGQNNFNGKFEANTALLPRSERINGGTDAGELSIQREIAAQKGRPENAGQIYVVIAEECHDDAIHT